MAAEKTTKKATPAKKTVKKAEVVSEATLHDQLKTAKQDLLDAKKSHRSGELVNPKVLGNYRKNIARILTAIKAETLKESK